MTPKSHEKKKSPAAQKGSYSVQQLQEQCEQLQKKLKTCRAKNSKAVSRRNDELALKPYQAELLKLQSHMEREKTKFMILFEGRDASGKGGTIRRTTRYMNEKHYRVVALCTPTETQKTQCFFQRDVEQFPPGG